MCMQCCIRTPSGGVFLQDLCFGKEVLAHRDVVRYKDFIQRQKLLPLAVQQSHKLRLNFSGQYGFSGSAAWILTFLLRLSSHTKTTVYVCACVLVHKAVRLSKSIPSAHCLKLDELVCCPRVTKHRVCKKNLKQCVLWIMCVCVCVCVFLRESASCKRYERDKPTAMLVCVQHSGVTHTSSLPKRPEDTDLNGLCDVPDCSVCKNFR